MGLPQLNPTEIVPAGPLINFDAPHNRQELKKHFDSLSYLTNSIP
jgi:hypothetical protein